MIKRLLAAALTLALFFGSASVLPKNTFYDTASMTASAESYQQGDFVYRFYKLGVFIEKYVGDTKAKKITIPDTLGGKPVRLMADDIFTGNTYLTDLVLSKHIEYIGENAFSGCTNLKSIRLPQKLKVIDKYAFKNCKSLENVTLYDGLVDIDKGAFYGCESLKSINIPEGIKFIDNYTFYGCKSLTNIVLPESVDAIYSYAFAKSGLKSIVIPDVNEVGDHAFSECTQLESVTVLSPFSYLYSNTFEKCDKLKTIYCPKNSKFEKYAKENGISVVNAGFARIAGANRFETACQIAKEGFYYKSFYHTVDTVILANGMSYADALAGVPLGYRLDAPILLTNTDSLPDTTLNQIKGLSAKKVIILGGTGAVSSSVEEKLKKEKLTVERIAGKNRYATAASIAQKYYKAPTDIFFVYGGNYADALSIGPIAALKYAPIVYLPTDGKIDNDTAAYLSFLKGRVQNAYVIGGKGVISDAMMNKAASALGMKGITRVAGKDRYKTCIEVNKEFSGSFAGDSICAATGTNFPDALAGGVYAAKISSPLLLVSNKLNNEQITYLRTKPYEMLYVFGGISVVPTDTVYDIVKTFS